VNYFLPFLIEVDALSNRSRSDLCVDELAKVPAKLPGEQFPGSPETRVAQVRTCASGITVKRGLVERAGLVL
jgi:hypothetical protein